jgi:DNA ligase (NAD+)
MDIEEMGEAVVKQLVEKGLVKDFSDIYSLKEADLLKLELFKEKKARNLLTAIEKSKHQSLSRLIYGLGIRHVGEKAAYLLAQRFRSMEKLRQAKLAEFDAIYEVGQVMAGSVVAFLRQEATQRLLKKFQAAGLNLEEHLAPVKKSAISGKTIVFTGELQNFSRLQAEALARSLGANASSSVSKNTDLVVAGEKAGSKYDKARKLGVKIIDEKQFKEMIK